MDTLRENSARGVFLIEKTEVKILHLSDLPKNWKPRFVKMRRAAHVREFMEMRKRPKPIDAVRVSADAYIKPSEETGELHLYEHASDKSGCTDSVRRTLANLRLLINANCSDASRLSWVTLTYAENMTDTKRLYSDYEKFWKRFAYWLKKQGLQKPEYIAVAEPQGRGAWHLHCLWIWQEKAPFIDNNSVLWKLWGHGFTKIKAVRTDCDNLGAYFSAYLADMTADEYEKANGAAPAFWETEEKQVLQDDGSTLPKKIVKGARLRLYPVGMNIYRASRGIVRPETVELTPEQAEKEKASAGTLTFSSAVAVVAAGDDVGADSQIIRKLYYNAKRAKSQAPAEKAAVLSDKGLPFGLTFDDFEEI